ncbi:MAG: hypothetical protein NW206_01825 [Hyphomonadaceae bacterium]|nr:hypothetical protein [Hyphomonadaceae bacterium]
MKRFAALAFLLLAASCTASRETAGVTTRLAAADAATALMAGQTIELVTRTRAGADGQDPLILVTLRAADGRSMSFNENNHAPNHLMAQAPGGPLAQIMGLFGEEAPKLYGARREENSGAPFICGPDGPAAIGVHETADGGVQMVGLKQEIEFETLRDGTQVALPYSPDMVCARLRFSRS